MMEPPVAQPDDTLHCVKRTYNPSVIIRKRRHGFLKRHVDSAVVHALLTHAAG